ncbi:PQQ-dependent sugar dehydrogenase [Sulfidibacter corallicola]|uniref:PQQ-dependent sugar dehydrogenase n=1 Tax=Sulfidibacter corallicola TaxID=2818388 RepID=A0A8A4TJ01_SULCO|nr:PQQ-dependent sugar dehydrogenase [Sulfidibacter corallicola]QTD49174.1 PQQ-dependent sugar dehydrogenase [Sulfidibacter corallicola]
MTLLFGRGSTAKVWAVILWIALDLTTVVRAQTVSDPNFVVDAIHFGNGMISIEFLPNGSMLVCEKRGVILLFTPDGSGGFNDPTTFADLRSQIDATQESGLLGMAVDPEYDQTRHIYLFYTTNNDERLTRITANASHTAMSPGSETVILDSLPKVHTFHNGGDIQFHPNEPAFIYIALGDDNNLGETDDTPNVQHPDFYEGKILRVNKVDGGGIASNPFYDGNANSIRSRVWAVGFRNPFRVTFHPGTPAEDVLYNSENGNSTDRLSWVKMGSNGAWSAAGDNGGFLDPPDPNHRVMAARPPSQVGIAIADGGPFAPDGPVLYTGNWWPNPPRLFRWSLTGADLDTLVEIPIDGGGPFVDDVVAVDLQFGPDGWLYLSDTGVDEALGGFYALRRVRFIAGTPPDADFTTNPSPATGVVPLNVQFSDQSTVSGGSITDWSWDFGDGNQSSSQNPSHTYTQPGRYQATLEVTSNTGLKDTAEAEVLAYQVASITLDGTIFDGRNLNGNGIAEATELRFYQTDGVTPAPVTGGTGPDANRVAIAAGGIIDTTHDVSLLGDGLVVSAGEPSSDSFHPAWIGIPVQPTVRGFAATLDFYLSDTMITGRALTPRGEPAVIDIGTARGDAQSPLALPGGRDLLVGTPTGVAHRRTTDGLGYYHIAVPSGSGNATFFFDLVGDTNTGTYPSQTHDASITSNQAHPIDYTIGQYSGGATCDDLDGIAETPNIDYASQIQPIWSNNCTGCHDASGSNNGGLNLLTNSFDNLVEQPSSFVPGLTLVTPGRADRSYLFEKVNCGSPQFGNRMRPFEQMDLADQALIRDWIRQLDPSAGCSEGLMLLASDWPDENILSLVTYINSNCR